MKILIINGPNINLLGLREPEIYGNDSYDKLCKQINACADKLGIEYEVFQSNHEGDIIDKIQSAYNRTDAIVINPAAYTHTSIAIADAIKAVKIPTAEVHITAVDEREEYRRVNYIRNLCVYTVTGHGIKGYIEAIEYLKNNYES